MWVSQISWRLPGSRELEYGRGCNTSPGEDSGYKSSRQILPVPYPHNELTVFDANPEPGSDKVGHPPFYLVRRAMPQAVLT